VQHPSLGAALTVASKQMKGFGGCFALELSTEAAAKALPGALKLFRSATSLGGVEPWIEGVAKLMATNPATWLFNWTVWLFRPGAEHADDGGWYTGENVTEIGFGFALNIWHSGVTSKNDSPS